MRQTTTRWSALMHALAAIVGTLPVALFANACIARFAPLSAETRFALAYAALIPTWLVAMCWAWLARSPLRVWLICVIATALLAGLTYGIPVEQLHACNSGVSVGASATALQFAASSRSEPLATHTAPPYVGSNSRRRSGASCHDTFKLVRARSGESSRACR